VLGASVLLADISGFTRLADSLAEARGERGAEELQDILNRCFAPLTAIVDAAGGEVLCFPGDAALAVWTSGTTDENALTALVQQAAACGLELQRALARPSYGAAADFRFRIAIGAGPAAAALVGGVEGQWEAVLYGAPVEELRGTLDDTHPGEVVLSASAARLAVNRVRGQPRAGRLVAAAVDPPIAASSALRPAPSFDRDATLRSFVPAPVRARLDAAPDGWLAEFRTVSVAFVRLADVPADPAVLQHSVRAVQAAVVRLDGVVNQVVADDQGLTIVAAFGLALRAHEDDAARAVRAAFAIREALADGPRAGIGISTGRAFTGKRGGASRVELAVIGSSVVLAARLAQIAGDRILCDTATRAACRRLIRFGPPELARIKGRSTRVNVCRPLVVKSESERLGTAIVARERERTLLEERVEALERGSGGVVVVEGEPGIGKSALLSHLLGWAQPRAVRCLAGGADAIERHTPYRAWRPVVAGLLGAEAARDEAAERERLALLLGRRTARWAPLLNPLLPLALPETPDTRNLDVESRARTTRKTSAALLLAAARSTPLLVVLEDAHWMDWSSWELAEQVVARVPQLLLVVSVRSPVDGIEPLDRLVARPDATRIRLEPLAPADIRELLCRRLDVDSLPGELAALVDERAEGHPLFAAELAAALRAEGAFVVHEGACRMADGWARLKRSALPLTVQGVVATRIDQLTPE
jgi:class 3 adenylate cyclase